MLIDEIGDGGMGHLKTAVIDVEKSSYYFSEKDIREDYTKAEKIVSLGEEQRATFLNIVKAMTSNYEGTRAVAENEIAYIWNIYFIDKSESIVALTGTENSIDDENGMAGFYPQYVEWRNSLS